MQNLDSEVKGHEELIKATLDKGRQLLDAKHYASEDIKAKSAELRAEWGRLGEAMGGRRAALHLALKGQQFLFDAAEVEAWLGEKRVLVASEDLGQDEDAAGKLLTKHKALQADLDAYKGWLGNVGENAAELARLGHPEAERLQGRQAELELAFADLEAAAARRRAHLEAWPLCLLLRSGQ